MRQTVNVIFDLSSSHIGWKTTSLSLKDVRKCSSLYQELANGKSHNNSHLMAPDLSRGYSRNRVSLQDYPNENSSAWINDNQIQNSNPPVTHTGCDSNGNNPQLIGKKYGASMPVGMPILNETTT